MGGWVVLLREGGGSERKGFGYLLYRLFVMVVEEEVDDVFADRRGTNQCTPLILF